MSAKNRILARLASKTGLEFEDSELSPALRGKIDELVTLQESYNALQSEMEQPTSRRNLYLLAATALLVWGLILLIVLIGAILLLGALFFFISALTIRSKVQQKKTQLASLNSEIKSAISSLATQIKSELSARPGARDAANS